jgi:peptide/nickel transport system permease protein
LKLYQYAIRKVLLSIPTFFIVSVIIFSMIHLTPGDPVLMMVNPLSSKETIHQVRVELGLDKPLYIQYVSFMKRILTGDLGKSLYTHERISDMILQRLPNTLTLGIASLIFTFVLSIPAGVISAVRRRTAIDHICVVLSLIGLAVPQFWLGLILILLFSVKLGWFPVAGYTDLKHLVLPAITLGAYGTAITARLTRSSMLEVIRKDYIRTARSEGIDEKTILYKHALKNALIPIISLFGLQLGWLVGGAVMVEYVFNRPGLGRLLVESIYLRDFPVVQVAILYLVISVILANLVADILYALVDPRIKY